MRQVPVPRLAAAVCIFAVLRPFAPQQAHAQVHQPLTPSSQLELPRLLDLCADRLQLKIDYDPGALKGTVTLRTPESLSVTELWSLANQMLAQRGFTTVRAPGSTTLSVVKSSEAAGVARVEASLPQDEAAAGFASLVVSPRHRTVKDLAESLRPLLTKGVGSAQPLGDSKLLLVSDYLFRISEIHGMLDRLDAPNEAMVVEEIACENVQPAILVATLTQVALKRDAAGGGKLPGEVIVAPSGAGVVLVAPQATAAAWRDLVKQFDKRESVETRNYVPRVFAAKDVGKLIEETAKAGVGGSAGKVADDRWKVVVDELTGTLVVTATPSQHAAIAALMERLDAADGGPTPMRSYPIRNRPVAEMVETLSRLIEAGVLEAGGDGSDREAVRAAAEQRSSKAFASTPGGVTAGSGQGSSASVIPPSDPTRTTFGEATRAGRDPLRLTADEATNTLIAIGEPRLLSQLESLLPMLDVRQPQVMLEVMLVSMTDTDAINFGVELQKIGSLGNATTKIASLFGLAAGAAAGSTGFTGAVLNPGEFSVVVQALQRVNKGNSLSNPKVLVTNNQQASFTSTLQQPYTRTDTNNNSSTTSSYGGSDDAGTTISVKPQIAQGEHLALTYKISLSSFVGTPAAAGLPPPKQQNSVDSVATIPDGHTVVVGGLDLMSDSTSASQIPWIGDVPLLGNLFKNQSKGASRSRFFVFIKATVMRSGSFEDLKYVSGIEGSRMGVNDGLPEVRPRVIR